MKEQTQQPGVRKWAGDDMIALQAEPLSAIQGFFEEYGNCIIKGCAVVPAAGGKFDIAPGLLGLSGADAGGDNTFKVVPFSGVENVTLPLYFTLTHSVVDRVYGDGKVKPIAYDYRAAVSAVKPAAGVEFLELTTAGGRRFVDAVKITEKLDKVGNGKDVTVTFSQAASRVNIASGEKLTTILGKVVRWLADLKALAFKDKVGKADLDAALQAEVNGKVKIDGSSVMTGPLFVNNGVNDLKARFAKNVDGDSAVISLHDANNVLCSFTLNVDDILFYDGKVVNKVWHAGNFNPATKEPVFTKNTAFNKNFGTAAGTVCQGNDARLSDSRPANGGTSEQTNAIVVQDTRTSASTPSWLSRSVRFWFSNVGTPNAEWWSGLHINGWDGPHAAWELCGPSSNGSPNSRALYFRSGSGGTFNAWQRVAFSADIPTSLPANGGNADTVGGKNASDFVQIAGNQTINGSLTVGGRVSGSVVFFNRASARKGYVGLGMSDVTDVYVYNDVGANYVRVADNGKNYSNDKEIATVDQIPTDFSQIGDAANVVVEPNTVIRKTVVCAEKNGHGFRSRVALGLTNPGLLFSPAILSVGVNDAGTSFVDYVFGTNGRISSPTGTFALTSEIKALSGGAAATAGQYVSGITVNDHEITVTKAALPTSDLGGIGANGADWNTFTTPGANWTNPMGWGTNAPPTSDVWGILTVSRSNSTIIQTYDGMGNEGTYKRVKYQDGSWSNWKQCAMKDDIPVTTAGLTDTVNKRFMSDAQEAKLDGGLEVAFAGVVDKDGNVLKQKGRNFIVTKNTYGLFTVRHYENDAFLIVQVMSEGGQVSVAHSFTSSTFKVDSYAGAGGDTNGRGFRIVAYKL